MACKRLATSEAMPWFVVIETLFSLDARGDGDALKRSIGRFESVFNALIAKRYLGGTSVGFGSGGEPETTSDDVLGELFGTRPRGPGVVFFERLFLRTRGRGEARLLCGL